MLDELMIRYNEFVNRDGEINRFCQILDDNEYIAMVIQGQEGIGKTSLQKRLIWECREVRTMRWAETFWIQTRSYNYIAIMRKIRDDIGEIHFQPFTDLLNYFTKPDYELNINVPHAGEINMLSGASLSDVKTGDVSGVKVQIQDLNLNTPREDKEIREQERMYKLTQQFLTDLTGALGEQRLVILIDDLERMTPETSSWLWSEFVKGVIDRKLSNIRFVFCIDTEPQVDEYLKRLVRASTLRLLNETHILEYLHKRKVGDESQRQALAMMIMANTGGVPLKMRDMVKLFLDYKQNKDEEQ